MRLGVAGRGPVGQRGELGRGDRVGVVVDPGRGRAASRSVVGRVSCAVAGPSDPPDDLGEQRADPRPGVAARLEDLLVGQRLGADAGRGVGDQRDRRAPRGPTCRAAIASSVVDMPTRSAPMIAGHRGPRPGSRSAGRGTGRTRPRRGVGSTSWATSRSRWAYRSVRSTNVAPSSGDVAVRLRWSRISTGVPGSPVGVQPAAAVGQHDRACAGGRRGAHAVHDAAHALALVQVGA